MAVDVRYTLGRAARAVFVAILSKVLACVLCKHEDGLREMPTPTGAWSGCAWCDDGTCPYCETRSKDK